MCGLLHIGNPWINIQSALSHRCCVWTNKHHTANYESIKLNVFPSYFANDANCMMISLKSPVGVLGMYY